MFKLTSGLAGARVTIDVDEFLRQAGDLAAVESTPAAEAQRRDSLTTPPVLTPLRVRAMQLVSEARQASAASARSTRSTPRSTSC